MAANACAGSNHIVLPAGRFMLTRVGVESNDYGDASVNDLDVLENVTLSGAGKAATTIDASQLCQPGGACHRAIEVLYPGPEVTTVRELTIIGGRDEDGGGGGALYVPNGGPLVVRGSGLLQRRDARGGSSVRGQRVRVARGWGRNTRAGHLHAQHVQE